MCHNKCGPLQSLYHVGHGERFSRSGCSKQNLVREAVAGAFDEFGDGARLVAFGRKRRVHFEFLIAGHKEISTFGGEFSAGFFAFFEGIEARKKGGKKMFKILPFLLSSVLLFL